MFHKAVKLEYGAGTTLYLTFQTGEIKEYDISMLFDKYPQLTALKKRRLFISGQLMGGYGIVWHDDLDLETETVYEDGINIGTSLIPINIAVANALLKARAEADISQVELAQKTGIDQADISKIESGLANPSITTLNRLAHGLNAELTISFNMK